ncbi:helix-turn-helix domain-containing protein [Plantactinospora sp. B24E8]|uniref:ArsR/SmtB family transcription factor n=1 Tax=Plantactinospora sp. B24E8 TaxID=3153567 RepID=UPI00325CEFDE
MSHPEVRLTDPRALRGYAHPLRLALVGLLRREGPLTATQAAERLNESVPSCSYHLRQLARYGLAERVPGADGRERPWRATALMTSWDDTSDDPALRAAADQLNAVILEHYLERARAHLAQRAHEPPQWRALTGFGDALVYLTAEELAALTRQFETLLAAYDDRLTDPTRRPAGSRPISIIQLLLPTEAAPPGAPAPPSGTPAPSAGTPAPSAGEPAGQPTGQPAEPTDRSGAETQGEPE